VTYVTGDVAGTEESPVYAILKMKSDIEKMKLAEGYELKQFYTAQPRLEARYSMKWDGEWHITYEVFRDLGVAFARYSSSSISWSWPGSGLYDATRHYGPIP